MGGRGNFIIDARLDKDTADRLVAAGVTHAPLGSNPAVAKWVADGYAKLPKSASVPSIVEFNDAPFLRNPTGVAYFDADRSSIELPKKMDPADAASQANRNHASGYWSTNDEHHALLHEIGHFNHLRNIGKQEFVAGMKATSINNASDRAIITSQVSRYAANSKVNFVAEVFAGKCTGKRYGRHILKLYNQMGGP